MRTLGAAPPSCVGIQRSLAVHDLESFRLSHRFFGVAVSCLRLSFVVEYQRYPSVLTGLKVETKAIRNRLDLVNLIMRPRWRPAVGDDGSWHNLPTLTTNALVL